MTHEHTPGDEPAGGPQHDHRLPDAADIPVMDGPFDLVPFVEPDEWDDDMDPEYAADLAAAVALGLTAEES